ncbi:MAG: hypothetical protein ACLFO2_01360 [Candidatus Woesearchaeota archaeon]
MSAWICLGCHAVIPQEEKPRTCPLCNQHREGFEETEKEEKKDPEDEKYSEIYKKTLEQLEEYDEGCEPEQLKYCGGD